MIYAMSDLHGEYEKYLAMLKKIKFSDDDELYILGDVVDRGQKPVEILRDMSMRHNVFPIMGNHDKMAIDVLSWLLDEVNEANLYRNINEESMHAGLGEPDQFDRKKPLDQYTIRELAFVRFDYDREYFGGDTYIVTGHTPTLTITGKPEIYHSHNNICIDCGAVFTSGALACLCLDNMKEFYVD